MRRTVWALLLGGAVVLAVRIDAASQFNPSASGAARDEPALPGQLGRVTNLHVCTARSPLFSDLTIYTDLAYPDAGALAAGRSSARQCYVVRGRTANPFIQLIELGHQDPDEPPVYLAATSVTAAQAELFGVTPDRLVELSHQYCRFTP